LLVFTLVLVAAMLAFAALCVWLDPLWFIGAGVVAPVWLFILSFFRDPNRAIPADADALVSPADGTVTHLEEVDDPTFPGGRAAGDCAVRNEQLWLDLEDDALAIPIRVKQVSGAIARRIVCWLRVGEQVARGERLGMIKFGSRTDVLVPAGRVAEVCVKVGQSVSGGSQVLLRLRGSV